MRSPHPKSAELCLDALKQASNRPEIRKRFSVVTRHAYHAER
jgi:hypothetical protein